MRKSIFIIGMLGLAALSNAQVAKKTTDYNVPYDIKPGTPEGSYRLSGIDNINPHGGKLSVALPVLEIGTRGEAGYTVTVNATLPSWNYELELTSSPCANTSGDPDDYVYKNKVNMYWWSVHRARYGPGMVVNRRSGWNEVRATTGSNVGELYFLYTSGHIVFLAPDGTEHVLYDNRNDQKFTQSDATYQSGGIQRRFFAARDGSGMTFDSYGSTNDIARVSEFQNNEVALPTGVLRFANGTKYDIADGKVNYIEDRNGNRLLFEFEGIVDPLGEVAQQLPTYRITKATDSIGRVTTFSYGQNRNVKDIDGIMKPATVDVISYKGTGGDVREILVERKLVSESIAPNSSASSSLFTGLSIPQSTADILIKAPRTVVLANGSLYRFRYNAYGEIAQIDLPTGGRFEYTHGAGFNADPAKASFAGGRILDQYFINSAGQGGCIPRPMGNPGWKPFIYRRLTQKRVYSQGSTPELILDYQANEALGTVSTVNVATGAGGTAIFRVNSSFTGQVSVLETGVGSTGTGVRRQNHFSIMPGANGDCANSNQPAWLGPFAKLQCDTNLTTPDAAANPDTREGKEWKTEWGGNDGSNQIVVQRRIQTNFGQLPNRSYEACWQRTTEIKGAASLSKTQVMLFDQTWNGTSLSAVGNNFLLYTQNPPLTVPAEATLYFSNLTDTFDYDWGLGPDLSGGNGMAACPLVAATLGYSRWTHHEMLATTTGKEAYRDWKGPLTQLVAETTTFGAGATTAAKTINGYDEWSLEGTPSTVNSVVVDHQRGNVTQLRVQKSAGSEMATKYYFDANGQRARMVDASGNVAAYSYADNYSVSGLAGGTNGFLSSLTYPKATPADAAHVDQWQVDPFLGRPVQFTAKNTATATYTWNDELGRLKAIDRTPANGPTRQKTAVTYVDTVPSESKPPKTASPRPMASRSGMPAMTGWGVRSSPWLASTITVGNWWRKPIPGSANRPRPVIPIGWIAPLPRVGLATSAVLPPLGVLLTTMNSGVLCSKYWRARAPAICTNRGRSPSPIRRRKW